MLIPTLAALKTPVKTSLWQNRLLIGDEHVRRSIAVEIAPTEKSASMLLDTRHTSNLRLYQSRSLRRIHPLANRQLTDFGMQFLGLVLRNPGK
jgi:hypothetical protein